jgi:putative ABC transport system substrate-binding protein
VQIIREVIPSTSKVALLYDLHLDQTQVKSAENIARNVGIKTLRYGINQPSELRGAFRRASDALVDAMLVHSSPVFVDQAAAIAELALEHRMPTIGLFPVYAKAGGLFSYGPNNFELFKQAGAIAGKILRGANPAEFPIERPVYLSFVINFQTAKTLHIVDLAPFVDGLPHLTDVGIRQVVPIGGVLVGVGLRHDALGDAALR